MSAFLPGKLHVFARFEASLNHFLHHLQRSLEPKEQLPQSGISRASHAIDNLR